MNINSLNRIYEYIDSVCVMTLSTSNPETGAPRATPVFFVRRGRSYYFVSFSRTVHASNIAGRPSVCVSIARDYSNYAEIQGAQIFGTCRKISELSRAAAAGLVFFAKFPDIRSFMSIDVLKSAKDSDWYEFKADRIVFTDNTIKFGYREEIDLSDQD